MADENILDTRPKGAIPVVFTPPWWVDLANAKNDSILQAHHPVHGWLGFVFSPDHAVLMGTALIKHCGLCEYFAATTQPSTVG